MKIGYEVNLHYSGRDRIATVHGIVSKTRLDLTVKNPNQTTQQFLNVAMKPKGGKTQKLNTPYWSERKQKKSDVKSVSKDSK